VNRVTPKLRIYKQEEIKILILELRILKNKLICHHNKFLVSIEPASTPRIRKNLMYLLWVSCCWRPLLCLMEDLAI